MAKIMNKNPNGELDRFKEATMKILARKIHMDYRIATQTIGTIEPEHFVEVWIDRNIIRPNVGLKKDVWHLFVQNLLEQKEKNEL